MLTELRKSTNSILFERVTSPLFGTLTVSWLIWNWKIVYLTLFVSENKIDSSKIDFIITNYSDINCLLVAPLISSFLLITIVPFLSNGAYWLHLKFKKWKIDQKNQIELKQLLTIEQSINLRNEVRESEIAFQKILEKKDLEIANLNLERVELTKRLDTPTKAPIRNINSPSSMSYGSLDYENFKRNKKAFQHLQEIAESVREKAQFPEYIDKSIQDYYLINEIIEKKEDKYGVEYYLTMKGNGLYKDYFNEKFEEGNKS